MACQLPSYVGRDVSLEYALACGDVDPRSPDFVWTRFGAMRTKEFSLTWDTADTTADDSVGSLRGNLATFKSLEISGDGVARLSTNNASGQSAFTSLSKHVFNPGEDYSDQPVAWIRMTFKDLTFIAYMLITDLSRSAPYDDVVTFSFTAMATDSDFGLIVEDTPDPSVSPTALTVTPETAALTVGQTRQLSRSFTPANANPGGTWSSSAPTIASVSSTGLVTALDEGTATITFTSTKDNTKSDSCAVTVS